jgi:PBP1b-binding outer membrane lipoprotein LpoB
MKKFFILASVLSAILFLSACSATWEGVKEDSSNAWDSTKETIHDMTE